MSAHRGPLLFLSAESPRGRPLQNPVFVAVPVTASLQWKLAAAAAALTRTARSQGHPRQIRFTHTGAPLYWDFVAGTALDIAMEDRVDWLVTAHHAQAELWGRRQLVDGGFGALQRLVRSRAVSLVVVEQLAGAGTGFVFDAHPGWADGNGEPFALAVHRRLSALSVQTLSNTVAAKSGPRRRKFRAPANPRESAAP